VERLNVGALQLSGAGWGTLTHYRHRLEELLRHSPRLDLLVLPEYALLPLLEGRRGASVREMRRVYDETFFPLEESASELFADLAHRHGLHILAGTHWQPSPEGPRNAAWFFTPDGRRFVFAKRRATPAEEAMGLVTGDEMAIVRVGPVRTGILICYDVEFPDLARELADAGCDILLVPSLALNERGYWRVHLSSRVRALENQVYVVMSTNQTRLGVPTERPLEGHGRSGIFGPIDNRTRLKDGVVAMADSDGDRLVVAELDLQVLAASRETSEAPLRRHWNAYKEASR
jgi:predicted amidohydrolase